LKGTWLRKSVRANNGLLVLAVSQIVRLQGIVSNWSFQMHLLSIQVGLPQTTTRHTEVGAANNVWTTAFAKRPISGPVWVSKDNIDGDGQASTQTHGGVEKACSAYPLEHYSYWQECLGLPKLTYGAFAENFTTMGLLETEVCIGDTFACGGAVVQVTQPRPPCWRLSRWWGIKDFAARMEQTGRTGWYLRVLQEGIIQTNAKFELIERNFPEWTVIVAHELMYDPKANINKIKELMACALLSESWRDALSKKIIKHVDK
jgi:MOSC domain-containing protein YiiM